MSDDLMARLEELLARNPKVVSRITQTTKSSSSRESEAKVRFDIKPLPSTFEAIRIGSHDWIRYWRDHPEQQEEMLKWKQELTARLNQALQEAGLMGGEE